MQFVKATIGTKVAVHDVKFYKDSKAPAIPATLFGNDKGETKLTTSAQWDRHYAYFKTTAAPADKVGYIELSFEEYTELATKKSVLHIEVCDRPADYAKRLVYPHTRIAYVEATAQEETKTETQEEQPTEQPTQAEQVEQTEQTEQTEQVEQPVEQEEQPTRPERRKNKAH
jgi:hypothetical protein